MKKLLTIIALYSLAACAGPRDEAYCDSFHLPKNGVEYANCRAYFAKMDNWFMTDFAGCQARANAAFPDYLYDHPHFGRAESIDRFGYIRSSNIMIEPDYQRNMSLDSERRKITGPCMLAKGWQSPDTWQAGRVGEKLQRPY